MKPCTFLPEIARCRRPCRNMWHAKLEQGAAAAARTVAPPGSGVGGADHKDEPGQVVAGGELEREPLQLHRVAAHLAVRPWSLSNTADTHHTTRQCHLLYGTAGRLRSRQGAAPAVYTDAVRRGPGGRGARPDVGAVGVRVRGPERRVDGDGVAAARGLGARRPGALRARRAPAVGSGKPSPASASATGAPGMHKRGNPKGEAVAKQRKRTLPIKHGRPCDQPASEHHAAVARIGAARAGAPAAAAASPGRARGARPSAAPRRRAGRWSG